MSAKPSANALQLRASPPKVIRSHQWPRPTVSEASILILRLLVMLMLMLMLLIIFMMHDGNVLVF